MTQAERITAMEVRLTNLENTVSSMDKKLDDLLALRYKGMGAFWLASGLFGAGIIGFLIKLFNVKIGA